MQKYFVITYDGNANVLDKKEVITDDIADAKEEWRLAYQNKNVKMCLLTDSSENIILKYIDEEDEERDNVEEENEVEDYYLSTFEEF